jgi:mycothiol system anti-sigma-R factor
MSNERKPPDVDEIGCIEAINALYAYIDGELDEPAAIAEFEHHLEHCRACYSRAELESALTERLKQASPERAPDALKKRLRSLIDGF